MRDFIFTPLKGSIPCARNAVNFVARFALATRCGPLPANVSAAVRIPSVVVAGIFGAPKQGSPSNTRARADFSWGALILCRSLRVGNKHPVTRSSSGLNEVGPRPSRHGPVPSSPLRVFSKACRPENIPPPKTRGGRHLYAERADGPAPTAPLAAISKALWPRRHSGVTDWEPEPCQCP
jgi:hypothetical protein